MVASRFAKNLAGKLLTSQAERWSGDHGVIRGVRVSARFAHEGGRSAVGCMSSLSLVLFSVLVAGRTKDAAR